jgi:hypothetical protein
MRQPLKGRLRRTRKADTLTGPVQRWRFGDRVEWREYVGQFYRLDPEDAAHAYIMVGARTYRVLVAELR